jgi:hypothetical protein
MVQRYTIGWVPQSKQSLPKPEAGIFENMGAAVKSGLNERFVALGIDAYNNYQAEKSELTIPEEEWTSSNIYWREGIDWTPNMTVDKAKIMSEIYDSDQQYRDLQDRTGFIGDALRGTTWFTTMMVADEINLIPFVGQIAKGAQLFKAGTKLAKFGNKVDVVGKGLTKLGIQGGYKEAIARGSVYTAGFSTAEQFLLSPGAEKYRRNREVELTDQLTNIALATATGGALGGFGYGIGRMFNKGKDPNDIGMTTDDIDTGTINKVANDIETNNAKFDGVNVRTETVDNINRPDVDGEDFGNFRIDQNTGRQRFDEDGLKTTDPNSAIAINTNATTGVVTITVKRSSLEFVVSKLASLIDTPFVNIKLVGKRAKTFSKAQLEDTDAVMKAFNVKRQPNKLQTSTSLDIVNIDGEDIGFNINRKTGDAIAYRKDAETGVWYPETSVNSKKLLHAAMVKDPALKKDILATTKQTETTPNKTDESEGVERQTDYDVRNEHKNKTHEQVADDLTSEGYRNIKTVEALDTLPETVGIRKREAKAGDNGSTTVKVSEYDEQGNAITRDKDITLITNTMKDLKQNQSALQKAKAKLEQFTLCNIQTGT